MNLIKNQQLRGYQTGNMCLDTRKNTFFYLCVLCVSVVILFTFTSTLNAQTLSPDQLFYDANTAYQQGNYPEAISLYEASLANGHSSAVYYNLGNAYYKNKQSGYAVLNYKKALALDASNADAKSNLHFLKHDQDVGIYNQVSWLGFAKLFSLNTWAWIASVSVWASMGLLIIPRLYGIKRIWITASTGTIIVIALISLASCLLRQTDTLQCVILENDTALKVAPTTHSPAVAYFQAGTIALVEKEHPTHDLIEGPRNQQGWVEHERLGMVWE